MSHQLMALPAKNTHSPLENCFPIYFCYFFYFITLFFFHGLFVFSHLKLDRKTFDHTMCEVNIKEMATILLQRQQQWMKVARREVKSNPKIEGRMGGKYKNR